MHIYFSVNLICPFTSVKIVISQSLISVQCIWNVQKFLMSEFSKCFIHNTFLLAFFHWFPLEIKYWMSKHTGEMTCFEYLMKLMTPSFFCAYFDLHGKIYLLRWKISFVWNIGLLQWVSLTRALFRTGTDLQLSHVSPPWSPSWRHRRWRLLCYTSTAHSWPRWPCLMSQSWQSWWRQTLCCSQSQGHAWSEEKYDAVNIMIIY